MNRLSSFLLLLFSQLAHSQESFTKFSEKKTVKWAAFVTDTLRFSNPNLSLLLRQQLNSGRIKAGTVTWDDNFIIDKNISKAIITERIAPNQISQVANDNGEIIATVREAEDVLLSGKYFDKEINDLVEMAQVIYIQDDKLRSYVPWASPKHFVYTSWHQKLGMANAFSTAFNTCRAFTSRQKRQSIFLGRSSSNLVPDSTSRMKMVKQFYGHQLLQELWPLIAKNNYELFAIDSSRATSFEQLTQSLLGVSNPAVPVYDEEGNLGSYQSLPPLPLSAGSFTGVALEQEWYYHSKKNRVFTLPTALLLYAKKRKDGLLQEEASPILKIMLR